MDILKGILLTAVLATQTNVVIAGDDHKKKTAFQKVEGELSVMVLGSGGPVATAEGRASAGYLIFTDGKPRILMDVGGGTFQRLAKSGTNIKDLDIVLLTHLHADHTGDLTSVMKTIYFHNNMARNQAARMGVTLPGRTAPINIYGPAVTPLPPGPGVTYPNGQTLFPGTIDYADQHYSIDNGVERYLKAFVFAISDDDGPAGPGGSVSDFSYTANELNPRVPGATIETVLSTADGLVVSAIAVDHGPVPSLAYRIEYKGHSIVYSGDTGSKGRGPLQLGKENMVTISQAADLLIYDTAVMEKGDAPANPLFHILHTQPSIIANVAIAADVKKIVLSHLTPVTSPRVKEIKKIIRHAGFNGKINAAKDLKVYNLGDDEDDD